MKILPAVAALAALLLSASGAAACPVCLSETGMAVRAAIFGESFAGTLVAVAAPFPIVAIAASLVVRLLPEQP